MHEESSHQPLPLAEAIESSWLDRDSRETRSWLEHRDINDVMLATSLAPQVSCMGMGRNRDGESSVA